MLRLQVTAYHEAGHTLIMHYTKHGYVLHGVTIKPSLSKLRDGDHVIAFGRTIVKEVSIIIVLSIDQE